MLDFVLGIYLAGLAVRGWLRGFVRELMDLVGLVVGAAIAFRMSEPFGGFLTDRFGATPEWGRIGAGIALFFMFGSFLTIVAHFLSKATRLPGLTLSNRLLGSAVAAAWGSLLVIVLVSVVDVLPVPGSVSEAVDSSTVARTLSHPDAYPRRLVDPLVGDQAVDALAAIERLSGGRRIVPVEGERITTEPIGEELLGPDEDGGRFVFDRLNADRLAIDREPLAASQALARLAARRARAMYVGGYVERRTAREVLAATATTSLRLQVAAEMVALASTERAAQAAIADAEDSALTDARFDRTGVAVLEGPLGVLVVEVYGG